MGEKSEHEFYMSRCIDLAKIAKERGDSPVGALILHNGKIIGEGIEGGKTNRDITFHAEIEAIRQVTNKMETLDLSDCFLYTTHEPLHYVFLCDKTSQDQKINSWNYHR